MRQPVERVLYGLSFVCLWGQLTKLKAASIIDVKHNDWIGLDNSQ